MTSIDHLIFDATEQLQDFEALYLKEKKHDGVYYYSELPDSSSYSQQYVKIKVLNGETVAFEYEPSMTIKDLKRKLFKKT